MAEKNGGKTKIFIDGREGTTGLRIYDRLEKMNGIELIILKEDERKDRKGSRNDWKYREDKDNMESNENREQREESGWSCSECCPDRY